MALPDRGLSARLYAPALLADVFDAIAAGTMLVAALPRRAAERDRARARLESLWARVDPQGVLDRLMSDPLPPELADEQDALKIEALLELDEKEDAATLLARHQERSPRWELLRARSEFGQGRSDEALARLDAILALQPLEPELKATALSFRFRYRALAQRLMEAGADVVALRDLLDEYGAVLSELIVRAIGVHAINPVRIPALRWRAAEVVDKTIMDLTDGVRETQAELGPLPRHVHALFRKLRDAPERLVSLAVRLAGAQFLAGRKADAWFTLYYTDQLAARLLPERWSKETAEGLDELRLQLGETEVAASERLRQKASDEHLARTGGNR
jgi:hypothetical protein